METDTVDSASVRRYCTYSTSGLYLFRVAKTARDTQDSKLAIYGFLSYVTSSIEVNTL